MRYLLICRSLTYAQRSARLLERAGITGTIARAPRSVSPTGCSYCVIVSARAMERAVSILVSAGLAPEHIYEREEDGTMEVVEP